MNEPPYRQALKRKISDAEEALEASLAEGATCLDLIRHDKSLQVLDRLLQRFPGAHSPSWLLPLSVAFLAVSLLGISAVIRLPSPFVAVDARLSAFVITAAADGTGLSTVAGIPIKSLEVAGDTNAQSVTAPAISISSLKLTPGTTAEIEQQASCFQIHIPVKQPAAKPGLTLALDLVVLHPPKLSVITQFDGLMFTYRDGPARTKFLFDRSRRKVAAGARPWVES